MGMSISRVGSIGSSSSAHSISGVYSEVTPQNYAVEGESEVSSAYTERVNSADNVNDISGITPSDPVTYSNATVQKNAVNQIDSSIEANKAYNDLAAGFSGNVLYDQNMNGSPYSVIGANIDTYA